jgi:putative IMPACT (imprinted ancient) family translation regulator
MQVTFTTPINQARAINYPPRNDDGEPGNSAGTYIYGQLQLTDVKPCNWFNRFGCSAGLNWAWGGLISAYKTTAQITLESCIIEKQFDIWYIISFDYKNMKDKVMQVIKEKTWYCRSGNGNR